MSHSLKTKIFISMILMSLLPLVLFEFVNYNIVNTSFKRLTDENVENVNRSVVSVIDTNQKVLFGWLDSSSAGLADILDKLGSSRFDRSSLVDVNGHKIPTWYFGSYKMTFDDKILDDFLAKQKIFATILQFHDGKFLRISTNVKQIDGTKIVGSVIDGGKIYDSLVQGKQFFGHSRVEGIDFATLYRPMFGLDGDLTGALVVGRREHDFELIDTINKIKIGDSGYVSIVDSHGDYIIHPLTSGENVLGNAQLEYIFEHRHGILRYESGSVARLAYFRYYEPLQWYIITTFNLSELYNANSQVTVFLLCFCFVILVISVAVSYYISTSLFKPISRLTVVMREVQKGNLNARFKHSSNNEFLMVALVFNTMLENISSLIKRMLHSSSTLRDASFNLIDDVSASSEALNSMGSGIEKLRQSVAMSLPLGIGHESQDNDVIRCFDEIGDVLCECFNEQSCSEVCSGRDFVFSRLNDLRRMIVLKYMVGVDGSDMSSSVSFQNKISNIEVELAKLKLLIRYISTSASSLDDIAISLDRYASVFNFDESVSVASDRKES